MCGIAGIVYLDGRPQGNLLSPILDTISHRGGKQQDIISVQNFELGICSRQLAKSHSTIVGIDGNLFHTKQLIADLQAAGVTVKGTESAELLIQAYECWGTSLFEHIQGDFAFFLLDQNRDRLILARDRIGKKPLYWYQSPHHLIFASELKGMLASGLIPATPATDSLAAYLYFGYMPQDMSPIKEVNKLLPANYLLLNRDGSTRIQPYWSYSEQFKHPFPDRQKQHIANFDTLLEEAVEARIPDTRPFGCFVSGGLGSASIAYYVNKYVPNQDFSIYTIGYQDKNVLDVATAREVAHTLGVKQVTDIITPKTWLDDLLKIVWYLDEPQAEAQIMTPWKLSSLAKNAKVVLSGMGSDELLAGHGRYTAAEQKVGHIEWLAQKLMPFTKSLLIPLLERVYKKGAYSILQRAQIDYRLIDFLNQNALFTEHVRAQAAPHIASLFDPHVFLHRFQGLHRIGSIVSSFLYLDVKTRLTDSYITQYERLTTAQGLDWRTPFLSRRILEYLARLLEPDVLSEKETFFLLKAILRNTYPDSVINRPKKTRKGFLHDWVEPSGLGKLMQVLPKGTLVENGLISEKWLRQHLATPDMRNASFPYLWSIFMLELWFRLFINNPVQPQPPTISIREFLLD